MQESHKNIVNEENLILLINPKINRKSKFVFERSAQMINPHLHSKINNDEIVNFSDTSLSSSNSVAMENIMSYFISHNISLMSYGDSKIPENILSSNKKTVRRLNFHLTESQYNCHRK